MEGRSIDGMEGGERKEGELQVAKPAPAAAAAHCGFLVRVLAFILTLAATIVIGTDEQTKVVPVKLVDTLPPVDVPVAAKWRYLSAFVYFFVANAIACAYAAVSLLLALANRGKSKDLEILMFILDTFMVALLFSGIGAAFAVGILGYHGNSHVQWNKVCNVFGRFCHQVVASVSLSVLGSLAFLFLVVLPLLSLRLHRRT